MWLQTLKRCVHVHQGAPWAELLAVPQLRPFTQGKSVLWEQNAALAAVLNSTCVALGVVKIQALVLGNFTFSCLYSLKISAVSLLYTALQEIPLHVLGECVCSEMVSFQPVWTMDRLEDGHGEINGITSREWEFHLLWVGVLSLGDCLGFSSAFCSLIGVLLK